MSSVFRVSTRVTDRPMNICLTLSNSFSLISGQKTQIESSGSTTYLALSLGTSFFLSSIATESVLNVEREFSS